MIQASVLLVIQSHKDLFRKIVSCHLIRSSPFQCTVYAGPSGVRQLIGEIAVSTVANDQRFPYQLFSVVVGMLWYPITGCYSA